MRLRPGQDGRREPIQPRMVPGRDGIPEADAIESERREFGSRYGHQAAEAAGILGEVAQNMNEIAEDTEIPRIFLRRLRQIIAVVPMLDTKGEQIDEDRRRGEGGARGLAIEGQPGGRFSSEEHTSERQQLMRRSYA